MLGSTLHRLAEIVEVAKLDLQPTAMTLSPFEGGTLAWYAGHSAAGGIEVSEITGLEAPISISPFEFKDLSSLFDDNQQVVVKATDSTLLLTAKGRRVTLKKNNEPDLRLYTTLRDQSASILTVDKADLLREITFAAAVVSLTLANRVLTGIRMVASGDAIELTAANGFSLVFEASLEADVKEDVALLLAPTETLAALKILGDAEHVGMHVNNRALVMQTKDAIVRIATLSGLDKWPPMANLQQLIFTEDLKVPAQALRALTAAARAYDKSASDVVLRPSGQSGVAMLETKSTELGQFQEGLLGGLSRQYTLSVADLETATKMSDVLHLEFSPTMALVTADRRRLYVLTRSS